MWQFLGTLAISAFGGAFLIFYLKNFLLEEKDKFALDWDGMIERLLITYLIFTPGLFWLIPAVIIAKISVRLVALGFFSALLKINEPGIVAQKVKFKAELALELFLSPAFAILVGIVF
ncbi:MAG: hypothetical protein PHG97_06460 [Candidatus Margulisbacteria bacterium]|nr:hypothetical protein [Candidatus Margulisiibacteriota bacterium]